MKMHYNIIIAVAVMVLTVLDDVVGDLNLVILHNNDMHGRFEETEKNSGSCQDAHRNKSCIGGFARIAHEVRRYRKLAEEEEGPEVLFLNAGDIYVGTVWYSLFTWNISTQFMNIIQPDVISLGNHEFDATVKGLVPFVNGVNCPIVAANLDFTNEPELQKIKKSVIIDRRGKKIGIIGYLTKDTILISNPGKVIFNDEIEALTNESQKLKNEGVDIIIALGHSGYLIDQKIAAEVPLVDVVVGGHTNTFLWNGPQPDTEAVDGPYPKVVIQKSGKKVPVVQAYAYTKYLGILNLTFDDHGDLIQFDGQPELLDHTIPQAKDVLELLDVYRPEVNKINQEVVGQSRVTLDGDSKRCRTGECNFGNLIADSLVSYKASVSTQRWTIAPIGLMNGGGIRNTIDPVNGTEITRGDLMGAVPFGNTVITMVLNGADLIKTLEIGARSNGETSGGEFLQISGLRVVYNMSRPSMSRVLSVKARCGPCKIPTYHDVELKKNYTIITTSFLEQGGDNHTILQKNGMDKHTEDLSDLDVLVWYFQHYSPVFPEVEGRIQFQNDTVPCNLSTTLHPTSVLTIFTCAMISFIRIFNYKYLVNI